MLFSSVNDKPFLAHSICLFLAEFQQVDTLRKQTKIVKTIRGTAKHNSQCLLKSVSKFGVDGFRAGMV